jgi:cytochrome c-type biogenesis protein CcmH/NrfG
MSEVNIEQSQCNSGAPAVWTSVQAYLLASFCLVLGVALGYLFRGSAASVPPASAGVQQNVGGQVDRGQAASGQADAEFQRSLAPLLDAVKRTPGDYDALVRLGDLYYDAQKFSNAIQYYDQALAIHPDNPDVRTDLGTAYWYTGNADKALAEMETSLKYKPEHPQTLFNLGWVRWQGKADANGAVAAWQKLLKTNPDYPEKQKVEQYIVKAKEHAARG